MVVKSRLHQALAAEKNTDFKKLKEKKKARQLQAKSQSYEPTSVNNDDDDWVDEHGSDDGQGAGSALKVSVS